MNLTRRKYFPLEFTLIAIGFVSGLIILIVFGLGALATPGPDFQIGWIGSEILFQNNTGEVISVSGACLIKEDVLILEEKYPEIVEEIIFPDSDSLLQSKSF